MATIDSYELAKQLVDNEGRYPGDPQLLSIWEYTNGGRICWCLIIVPADLAAMLSSPYVHNPEMLWSKEEGKLRDPTPPKVTHG